MPKSPKLASFPRVARPARARPKTHRTGDRTQDLYLTVQLEIRSGLSVGREIWGRQLTSRGGEIGVPERGSFWLLEMSQNLGVLPIVYLHTGLKMGSAITYAIHR